MALEMLLIASSLSLIAVCISSRTRCKESAISCLICCCNVIKSAVVAMPACHYATAVAAADLESLQVTPQALALDRAPLPSQMQLYFVATLSQRECVGRLTRVDEVKIVLKSRVKVTVAREDTGRCRRTRKPVVTLHGTTMKGAEEVVVERRVGGCVPVSQVCQVPSLKCGEWWKRDLVDGGGLDSRGAVEQKCDHTKKSWTGNTANWRPRKTPQVNQITTVPAVQQDHNKQLTMWTNRGNHDGSCSVTL